jgi:hypothetical protein
MKKIICFVWKIHKEDSKRIHLFSNNLKMTIAFIFGFFYSVYFVKYESV